MSHVNSESAAPGFATPARAFRAMLGEDAAVLLDAYGVEDVALGDLDLTPGLIERARAERATPRWPSLEENGIDGPTVRLSLGRGAGRRAEHGHRTHRNTSPPFLQLGTAPPDPDGAAGAFG